MKIIQLIYSLSSGGAERFVVDLSNQLLHAGHEIVICILRPNKGRMIFNAQFLEPSIRLESLNMDSGISLSKILQVENFIRKEHPDVVHCHLNVVPYIYRLSLVCHGKIKFFHTLHSVAEETVSGPFQKKLNRWFYFHRYIIPICISSNCRQSYLDFYGAHEVCYIDNGRACISPTKKINLVRQEVSSFKQMQGTPVFIHVARYHPLKNQALLVSVFNRLDKEGQDFVLLILGSGFDSDAAIKLRQTACDKIHFLGEKNNVGDYLLCSDAFCLTSHHEGLPISLLEALSCGVTPICTNVGGVPDVIIDGKNGYLSEEDELLYLDAIKRFLYRPIARDYLRLYFDNRFSMKMCAKKYEEVYQKNKF